MSPFISPLNTSARRSRPHQSHTVDGTFFYSVSYVLNPRCTLVPGGQGERVKRGVCFLCRSFRFAPVLRFLLPDWSLKCWADFRTLVFDISITSLILTADMGGWGEKRHLSKMTTCEWLTASKNCNQSWCKWPILCELRLSVDARIRTCKAGLVQVLIGLVKHIRCSDFEMSLTPIIPWHYSQAHGPRWAACLSTPHWRRKTTSVYEHLTATFHQVYILKERESDTELDFELWTFIHLSWMLWELFCH